MLNLQVRLIRPGTPNNSQHCCSKRIQHCKGCIAKQQQQKICQRHNQHSCFVRLRFGIVQQNKKCIATHQHQSKFQGCNECSQGPRELEAVAVAAAGVVVVVVEEVSRVEAEEEALGLGEADGQLAPS